MSDPVFQQGYQQWMQSIQQVMATMAPPTSTTPTSGGPGILSDIWTMASNPWVTTTGFVSGVGDTFVNGSAYDSLAGANAQMFDTMFGWTGIPIFQVENHGPIFGNTDAFQNGQTVGVVWGTANNLAFMAFSLANLPANIQNLINTTGSLVLTTGSGMQIVIGGTVTVEAVVPVVVNVAGALDGLIAMASAGGSSSGSSSMTQSQIQKSIDSLNENIAVHQQKLADYIANPDAYDNLGILQNAPTPEIRQQIINGRIAHLTQEIQNWQNQVAQLLALLGT